VRARHFPLDPAGFADVGTKINILFKMIPTCWRLVVRQLENSNYIEVIFLGDQLEQA
jgi:hypothetical protein